MANKATILKQMGKNARDNGYFLCLDKELLDSLIDGLAANEDRYGYGSCPCRMASGIKQYDVDIICPCEYRDADVDEFGMCYCGLFVNKALKQDPSKMHPIPERRPVEVQEAATAAMVQTDASAKSKQPRPAQPAKISSQVPVWRCTVCGYLCARETPPPVCPICKAKAERFEPFTLEAG